MATATYTCTTFNSLPKYNHTGVQSVSGSVVATATSTVGDVFFLAKIPHGAKFVRKNTSPTVDVAVAITEPETDWTPVWLNFGNELKVVQV